MGFYIQWLLPRKLGADSRRLRFSEVERYLRGPASARLGLRADGEAEAQIEEATVTVVRWTPEPGRTYFARFWGGRQVREPVLRHVGGAKALGEAGLRTPQLLLADRSRGTTLRWGFECTIETAAAGKPIHLGDHPEQLGPFARDLARLHGVRGERWGRPWAGDSSSVGPSPSEAQERLAGFRERITPETSGLSHAEIGRCLRLLGEYLKGEAERRPTLIHGDVFRSHVFADEDGELTWIDVETVQYGLPEWDLGKIRLWMGEEMFGRFLEGYEAALGEAVDRRRIGGAALHAQTKGLYKRVRKLRLVEGKGRGLEKGRIDRRREWLEQEIRKVMDEIEGG